MIVHGIAYLPGGPAVATAPRELSASLPRMAWPPCMMHGRRIMRAEFLSVFFVSLIQMLICMLCWMRLNFLKNTAATFELWHASKGREG
jgi:hypothetical protein